MILTEQQLEVAARKYCELTGLDPGRSVAAPSPVRNGITLDVYCEEEQWRSIARLIRRHNFLDEAVKYASET